MKRIIQSIFSTLARLTIARYKPRVIAVTGNVGKTSTKEAIYAVVNSQFFTRKSEKNYNNELGVPLTIVGMSSAGKNIFGWIIRIIGACLKLVWCRYPHVLVLEMGVDKPRDMDYLLSIVKPDIAVFTAIGDVPVHVENFMNAQSVVREKLKLAYGLNKDDAVILNADVSAWEDAKEKIKASVMTYGFSEGANVRMQTPEYRFETHEGRAIPLGITCKMEYKGSVVPFRLDGTFGLDSGAHAAGAACAVGASLGMNLVEMSAALQAYVPPRGRLQLIEGIKGSFILDDTYNASPASMGVALHTLHAIPGIRKIAVLGDMLELGSYSEDAHRDIGKKVAEKCDVVITVGERMRFAADEALAHNFKEHGTLLSFDTSTEAGNALVLLLQDGDLVLVKGSQGIRMEKAVKEIMAHPERASELLVRQDKNWVQ